MNDGLLSAEGSSWRCAVAEERLVALKFVLHLVGDLHQPLHAADDHDAGGNRKRVVSPGFRPGSLHHFWDTEWVRRLGRDPREVAGVIVAGISDQQRQTWSQGTAADWVSRSPQGRLRNAPRAEHEGRLRARWRYVEVAVQDVRPQLSRAGVRLAVVLNKALGRAP